MKVIILGGNARSGKTTLAVMLEKKGYNRISFDMLNEALNEGLNINKLNEELYKFFEIIVNNAIKDMKLYGTKTVIDIYDFLPDQINKLPFQEDIDVYFLAYPNTSKNDIKINVIKYAKPTDWIAEVNEDYLNECVDRFYKRNKLLVDECKKYKYKLIDTKSGNNRDIILNNLYNTIIKEDL